MNNLRNKNKNPMLIFMTLKSIDNTIKWIDRIYSRIASNKLNAIRGTLSLLLNYLRDMIGYVYYIPILFILKISILNLFQK